MSDINIIPNGMIAFIAAVVLFMLLLLGILVCSLYGVAKARRKKERFIHQPVMQHIFGMSLGLVGSIIVMLLVFLTEGRLRSVNIWLDNWIWLWGAVILLMWPLGVYVWRRRAGMPPL